MTIVVATYPRHQNAALDDRVWLEIELASHVIDEQRVLLDRQQALIARLNDIVATYEAVATVRGTR